MSGCYALHLHAWSLLYCRQYSLWPVASTDNLHVQHKLFNVWYKFLTYIFVVLVDNLECLF